MASGVSHGRIGFDSSNDLRLNAGPLERIQGLLGSIGSAMGKLTDKLVTYQVSGTLTNAKVEALPFGVGAESGSQ